MAKIKNFGLITLNVIKMYRNLMKLNASAVVLPY